MQYFGEVKISVGIDAFLNISPLLEHKWWHTICIVLFLLFSINRYFLVIVPYNFLTAA